MAKVQDYIETDKEREEGHADTRKHNFECEDPDDNLGWRHGHRCPGISKGRSFEHRAIPLDRIKIRQAGPI